MGDIKLFRLQGGKAVEVSLGPLALEKSLQNLVEANLETMLGVRFLATEHSTGRKHSGRIDTLGIDENGCPVIIEYKRTLNENVINQGLFYLDWLLDHKADFKLLVLDQYGKDVADSIAWSGTRLLCIAQDFTRYDEHAISQIDRNIELIRYRRYTDEMLLLDLVNVVTSSTPANAEDHSRSAGRRQSTDTPIADIISHLSAPLSDIWDAVRVFALSLGDDVQVKELKLYWAYKRIKNFMSAEVRPGKGWVALYLKVDPDTVTLDAGFSRDVRGIGHWGTGDLEITIRSLDDLERAKPLIMKSYEAS